MKVVVQLNNRKARFIQPYPYDDLIPFFSFHPPGYYLMPLYKRGSWVLNEETGEKEFRRVWDGKIKLLKRDCVASGLFRAISSKITEETGIEFSVVDDCEGVAFRKVGITSDRDYQNECVEKMIEASSKGGGLVLGATGTGKTYTAAMYFHRLKGSGCFIVDELTLLKQARQELEEGLGETVGEVGDQIFRPERITCATIQTMHLHREKPEFLRWTRNLDVLVIDEIHQAMGRRNFETVASIEPPVVFGLTATLELGKKPVRLKAYSLTGPVIYEYPYAQGVKEKFLAHGVVRQICVYNLCDAGKGLTAYQDEYRKLISKNRRRNDVVEALVREGIKRGKYVVCLVDRIQHLEILSGNRFPDIPHQVVYGERKVEDRIRATKEFHKGKIRLILANKVFKKGINMPKIDMMIDAAGMKSKNDARQKFGRGVRLCEGKTGLIYFDIRDEGNRFEQASKSRASALKKQQIQVKKVSWEEGPNHVKWVLDQAEKALKEVMND